MDIKNHNIHQLVNEWLQNEVNQIFNIDQECINDHTLHMDKQVLVKLHWNELSIDLCKHLTYCIQRFVNSSYYKH